MSLCPVFQSLQGCFHPELQDPRDHQQYSSPDRGPWRTRNCPHFLWTWEPPKFKITFKTQTLWFHFTLTFLISGILCSMNMGDFDKFDCESYCEMLHLFHMAIIIWKDLKWFVALVPLFFLSHLIVLRLCALYSFTHGMISTSGTFPFYITSKVWYMDPEDIWSSIEDYLSIKTVIPSLLYNKRDGIISIKYAKTHLPKRHIS